MNMDFNISEDSVSYTKSYAFGLGTTWFLTTDWHLGYEYSYTIPWDNSEVTVYFSESISLPAAAVAAAVAGIATIDVAAYAYNPAGMIGAIPLLKK